MIEIIEKERYYDDSLFTGQCYMYPTYMVKGGKEYFMFNRREPDDSWNIKKNEMRKKQLIETEGAYFKFNGLYSDPLEMIEEIAERKHHFTDPDSMYYCGIEECGFLDFHGNRNEVSAAFHYRIYDKGLAEQIQKAVEMLNAENWPGVIREIRRESV